MARLTRPNGNANISLLDGLLIRNPVHYLRCCLEQSSEKSKTGRDLTSGSILGNVLYMGVPSMLGFAAMVVYQLTDMFWVARIGTEAVAAITLFGSFAWVLSSINSMVGSGSVAVISRRYGEKDLDGTRNAIEQTLVLKFLIGLPMGIIGFFTIRHVLGIMTGEVELILALRRAPESRPGGQP